MSPPLLQPSPPSVRPHGWLIGPLALATAAVLCASLSGCQGCGPKQLRRYGATCGRNSECSGGVCYQGRCTRSCKDSSQCGSGVCIESVCHEPDSDLDGDGLSNAYELLWKLDPASADSDGDGQSDGKEIGPNFDVPDDTNGDGIIDARQSNSSDADGDCMVDAIDIDPSDASAANLPTPQQLCDLGVCSDAMSAVTVVCRPQAPQQKGVVFGCLGCGCAAASLPTWQAKEDRCDHLDNDCNGLTDEGQLWLDLPLGATCQVFDGVCGEPDDSGLAPEGVVECLADKTAGCSLQSGGSTARAGPETCNLVDDNCNGVKDEGFSFNGAAVGSSCAGCGETTFACADGDLANPPVVSCTLAGDAALCGALPLAPGFERINMGAPAPRSHWSTTWASGWQKLLVYGGAIPTAKKPTERADLWSLQPGKGGWQRSTDQAPGPRRRAALLWDQVGDRTLLVGGIASGEPALKVWSLAADMSWSNVSTVNVVAGSHVPELPFALGGKVTRAVVIGDPKARRLVVLVEGLNAIWSTRLDAGAPAQWQATSTAAIGKPGAHKLTGSARCVVAEPSKADHALVLMPGGTALSAAMYRLTLSSGGALQVAVVGGATPPDRREDQCVLDDKGKLHSFGGQPPGGSTSGSWQTATFTGGSSATGTAAWKAEPIPDSISVAVTRNDAFAAWDLGTASAVIVGGHRRVSTTAGPQRLGRVQAVRWHPATALVSNLATPVPAGRVGEARGRQLAGSLCIAGGLLYDLPDVDGQDCRVRPATDAWCADDQGGWTLITDQLPPYAFGMATVDRPANRMVLAGGYDLTPGAHVPEVWRLWQTGLTFDEAKPLASQPKVSNQVHLLDLGTGQIASASPGPKLAASSTVYDPIRRRMISFGGFDDVRPTRAFWRLDLQQMKWTDLGGELGPMKAQYGSVLVYDPLADVLAIAGGVQHNVAADGKDPIVRQIVTVEDGSTFQIGPCEGLAHAPMFLTRPKTPAAFKLIKIPTWADPEAESPKQKLFRPHFGQPAFVPTLFDPIGRRGLMVLPDVRPAKATDDDGKACTGSSSTPWTEAKVQVRVALGQCSGQPKVFLEPGTLSPAPTSMFMAAAGYDDVARRHWIWGGLEPDGSASSALWRLDQACTGDKP